MSHTQLKLKNIAKTSPETPVSVLMVLEGTYPFRSGGVSTWAHMLCNEMKSIDFTLYSVNGRFEKVPLYELGPNIKEVIQVPLWSPHESIDFLPFNDKFRTIVQKKESVSDIHIQEEFCPLFEALLEFVYSENQDMDYLENIFYDLWLYFERYDYKSTMKSRYVWNSYKEVVWKYTDEEEKASTSMLDMTTGMNWLYRFFIPLGETEIPPVSIVHLTLGGFSVIPAFIAKNRFNAKILLTEHGVYIRERLLAISSSDYSFFLKKLLIQFTECMTRFTYHQSELIVSVNQFNQKWELAYGAKAEKLKVIYNGIDSGLFSPASKPDHLNEIPTVVAAARVFELKDILTMIRSCAVVAKEIPDVQYLIYGDTNAVPKYTEECRKLIKKLKLENNFKFAGARSDPEKIFPEGDVSILTSISEGFPYTVIESMACGVPVVSTDVGGVSEALTKDCGILCKPKDAERIGEAVIRLLKNKPLRERMGSHARERVLKNFTIGKFVNEYLDLYETLVRSEKSIYEKSLKIR